MEPTAGRAGQIAFGILLALAAGLTLYVVWPFRAPLFLATVLAAIFQKVLGRLARRLGGRKRLAAGLTTASVFLVIVAPFASVVGFAAQEIMLGLAFLRDQLGVHSVEQLKAATLPPRAQAILDRALASLHLTREQIENLVANSMGAAQHAATEVLGASSRAAFHTVIMLVAFYFLLLDGGRLMRWIARVSPLEARQTKELLEEFRRVSAAAVIGTAATAVIQGVASGIGYAITGVPHAIFFGLLTAVASFIPIIGTALVWVPATLLLLLSGHQAAGIGLLVWSLVAVVGAEHVAKPIIMRGQVEMHTGLVFLALLGGIEMFGLIGIIIGPLVIAFFLALLRMYERDFQPPGAPPPQDSRSRIQ